MRNDKLLAYKMRMQGKSYTEISRKLGMAKSTLSVWFKNIVISKEAEDMIRKKSHTASINALLKINRQQTYNAEKRARETRLKSRKEIKALTKRELLLIGASLYWAEGYKRTIFRNGKAKTHHPVSFTNSDPTMVKIFLKFLREVCMVPEEKITIDLRIFEHQNEEYTIGYWSKITEIPFSNFKHVYRGVSISSKHKKPFNTLPYGTIQIRVNNTPLFHKIMGWIEGLQNS